MLVESNEQKGPLVECLEFIGDEILPTYMKLPILTNIYQRGWNHQLEMYFLLKMWIFHCYVGLAPGMIDTY